MASTKKGRIVISYCAINDATGKYETTYELLKVPNTTLLLYATNRVNSIDIVSKYIKDKPKFKNYRVNTGKIAYTKMNDSYNYFYDVPLINLNDKNDSKCSLPTPTPTMPVPEQINPSLPTGGRKRRKTMRKTRASRSRSRKFKKTRRH
jgi:hypothetical protein